MLKTGIYVDAENIRLCGGYGMRYDVLVELAGVGKSVLLRANSYLAEDGPGPRRTQSTGRSSTATTRSCASAGSG